MSKDNKDMLQNKIKQDELRQKVDGFSLDSKESKYEEKSYTTMDQGVYYPPDDEN